MSDERQSIGPAPKYFHASTPRKCWSNSLNALSTVGLRRFQEKEMDRARRGMKTAKGGQRSWRALGAGEDLKQDSQQQNDYDTQDEDRGNRRHGADRIKTGEHPFPAWT